MENLEFFQANNGGNNGLFDPKNGDHLFIDDLLNFPNDDNMVVADEPPFTATPTDSSTTTPLSSSFSAAPTNAGPRVFAADAPFSNDLSLPVHHPAFIPTLLCIINSPTIQLLPPSISI